MLIQEQSTNQFIAKVRQLTGQDIQTFEQINALLISEPHFDKEIVEILETSNYLTLWKIEFEKNPWYYDYEKFKKKHSKNQSESAARIMVITFKDLYQRFTPMENYYQENFKKTGLVFFKKLFELYTKLNELNNLRLTVAMDAMIDAGLSENEIMEIAQ